MQALMYNMEGLKPRFSGKVCVNKVEQALKTKLIVRTAKLAGRLLLENGAETYRVEDTVSYICNTYGLKEVSVISLPTGTIYSFVGEDGVPHSEVIRTKVRTTNLSCVTQVNDISRRMTAGEITLEEGYRQLQALQCIKPQPLWQGIVANVFATSFFALLFGANWFDFIVAAVCGVAMRLLGLLFDEDSISSTMYALLAGALSSVITVGSIKFFGMGNQTAIISGAIMPLIPGLAITNAIRDTVNGDLVSGVARTADALLKAVAIAAGVGVVIALWR